MSIPEELRRAYEAAWVEVEIAGARFVFPPVARGTPPVLTSLLRPRGFVITACNPGSVRLGDAENRALQAALGEELAARRWRRYPALGHDGIGTWREPSFAVVDAPAAELLALARAFSQNAVYEWGDGVWRVLPVPPEGVAPPADPALPPAAAPRSREEPMRLGVCSWSLAPADPADLVRKVRGTGIAAVQLALGPVRASWGVEETRRALEAGGIAILSGMMAMRGEDYSSPARIRETGGVRPDEHWEENLAHAMACADLARDLGISLVTFHAGFIPEEAADPLRARMVERLGRVIDVFADAGVRIAFETGQETAATLLAALREIGRPAAGVNFDPANMILYGMGDPIDALRRLAPRVVQVHIKDARPAARVGEWGTEVAAGSGAVDWRRFLGIVSALEPPVDLVIEREAGGDRGTDIRTAMALVRQTLLDIGRPVPS